MPTRFLQYLVFVFLGLISFTLLGFPYIKDFFRYGYPGGADGSSHFFLSLIYSQKHWPHWDGWIDQWFQGFPFPRFYPPLLYLILGLSYRVFYFLPPELVYKALVMLTLALIPGITGIIGKQLQFNFKQSFLCIIFSSFFLTMTPEIQTFGLGFIGTFEFGLSSQPLSVILLLSIFSVIVSPSQLTLRRRFLLTMISSLFFISNYHIILVSSILLPLVIYLYRPSWKDRLQIVFCLAFGFLLVSLWYYQAFMHRHESPGVSTEDFNIHNVKIFLLTLLPCIMMILTTPVQSSVKSLLSLGLFVIVLCLIPTPSNSIPWQPWRTASILVVLAPWIIVAGFSSLGHLKTTMSRWRIAVVAIMMIAPFLNHIKPIRVFVGAMEPTIQSELLQLREWLIKNPTNGYVVTGYPMDPTLKKQVLYYTLNSAATSVQGNKGIWTVFRESTLNSFFMVPLRNLFSVGDESFGVRHHLKKSQMPAVSFDKYLKLGNYYGISRLILLAQDAERFKSLNSGAKEMFSNPLAHVFDFPGEPILEAKFTQAKIFVGKFQHRERGEDELGIPWLGEWHIRRMRPIEPLLAATSCQPVEALAQKLGKKLKVLCGGNYYPKCCTTKISEYSEIENSTETNLDINVTIKNQSPADSKGIFAVPFRTAIIN